MKDKVSNNEKAFDATAARQLLKDKQAQRETACAAAIQAVLAEHHCALLAVPSITQDGRIVARIELRGIK